MNSSIHILIHGLTQSEKRYFTLQASSGLSGEQKQYHSLYEAILAQKVYDEPHLKQQFGQRYFAQYKKQLEEKIMESLRHFHAEKSMTDVVNNELYNYRLYEQKGLFKRAEKSLKRAKELAQRFELLPELLRVYEYAILQIAKTASAADIRARIPLIRKEITTIHQLMDVSLLIRQEYLHFSTLNKENEFLRRDEDAQAALSLIAGLNETIAQQSLPASATTQLHYLHGLCFFLCGKFEESKNAFLEEYGTFDQHPFLQNAFPEAFTKCIGNNALLALATGDNSAFERFFAQLNTPLSNLPGKNATDQYRRYLLQLKWFVRQQKWSEGQQFVLERRTDIRQMEQEFRAQSLLKTETDYVLFDTLRILLETKNYREARQLIHAFFSETEAIHKTDNYIMARIIFILLQLQHEQTDLAESEWRSLRRFIRKNKREFEFERLTLKFLSKLITNPLPEKQNSTLKAFSNELKLLQKEASGKMALFCFDLPGWLNAFRFRE